MGRPTNAQIAERKLLAEAMEGPAENALNEAKINIPLVNSINAENAAATPRIKSSFQPKITYSPVSESAPYETIWNKHRFRANVPVVVRDVSGGNTAAQMIESAKLNTDFMVDGFPRAQARPIDPETPEQYKTYAVGWIRHSVSSTEMTRRWRNEKDLREDCGVGTDDEEYLASIFQPRLSLLKESEKLQAAAVND